MPLPDQQLTDKQGSFAKLVAQGVGQGEAARLAGYADCDASGWRLARLPHIQRAIQMHIAVTLMGELVPMAWKSARQLMGEDQPGPVRLGAVKVVLAHAAAQVESGSKRSVATMSEAELEAELEKIQAVRAANAVDITPSLAPTEAPAEG